MLIRDSKADSVIDKFRAYDILYRKSTLDPLHQCRQHIVRALERYSRCCCCTTLTKNPRSRARVAVEHARDAEKAEKLVQLAGGCLHALRKILVEPFSIEAGNLVVLSPMVRNNLTAFVLEARQGRWPSADIRGVQGVSYGGIVGSEGRSIPAGRVDDVFEPFLREKRDISICD